MTDDEQRARAIVQRWLDTTEKGADAYPSHIALRDLAVLFRMNRTTTPKKAVTHDY
jgi:hypothetical protein